MAQPEDKMGEGKQQKNVTEGDVSQDSGGSSKLSFKSDCRRWYGVFLLGSYQRNEQKALLLDVLKCDKSVVSSIYQFRTLYYFEAHLTSAESEELTDLEVVESVSRIAKHTGPRLFKSQPKTKKQKISKGSILSQQRENKEKWRYNEDLEPSSEIEDSEDEDLLDDNPYRYEAYHEFDESGKRWYKVCLEDDMTMDGHKALLRDVLKWDPSELDDCIYRYGADHLFLAHMNEKDADKIAGLKEVEYVQPCRSVFGLD